MTYKVPRRHPGPRVFGRSDSEFATSHYSTCPYIEQYSGTDYNLRENSIPIRRRGSCIYCERLQQTQPKNSAVQRSESNFMSAFPLSQLGWSRTKNSSHLLCVQCSVQSSHPNVMQHIYSVLLLTPGYGISNSTTIRFHIWVHPDLRERSWRPNEKLFLSPCQQEMSSSPHLGTSASERQR